jgi:3-deoxy-7-phosphoheptulonate synthase
MHGNTVGTASGLKTRPLSHIGDELRGFFAATSEEGATPGGIHVETTGRDVAECTGGAAGIAESDLGARYDSHCDPRLNAGQAMEIATLAGRLLAAADRRARSPETRTAAVC